MEGYLNSLTKLDTLEILYAAVTAFILTNLIIRFRRVKSIVVGKKEVSINYKGVDITTVVNKCKSMFPIETISFRGQVFNSGMLIRITTMQKKVIEGQFIGKNNGDIICILTKQHIIAHEIDKIEDIIMITNKSV